MKSLNLEGKFCFMKGNIDFYIQISGTGHVGHVQAIVSFPVL